MHATRIIPSGRIYVGHEMWLYIINQLGDTGYAYTNEKLRYCTVYFIHVKNQDLEFSFHLVFLCLMIWHPKNVYYLLLKYV